jgi:hypothetical protein
MSLKSKINKDREKIVKEKHVKKRRKIWKLSLSPTLKRC